MPLKNKVFEVLRLIYEQQKGIGQQLYLVDQRVRILKNEFTQKLLISNPFLSYDDIEAIFKKYEGSFEVDKAMKELKEKN